MSDWISVRDRLPDLELPVDAWDAEYGARETSVHINWVDDAGPHWCDDNEDELRGGNITHWMPIPVAPAGPDPRGEVIARALSRQE